MRALQARTDSQLQSRLLEGRQQTRGGGPQGDETVLWEEEATSSSKEGWRRVSVAKFTGWDEQASREA